MPSFFVWRINRGLCLNYMGARMAIPLSRKQSTATGSDDKIGQLEQSVGVTVIQPSHH